MLNSLRTVPLLLTILILPLHLPVHAQSAAKGTLLIKEDFSGGEAPADPKQWNGCQNWNVAETWKLQEGAIACIYDPKKHPGKPHGTGITPKFKAQNIRISYRVKFDGPEAKLSVIPNTPFPKITGIPVWHIADINSRLPRHLPGPTVEKKKDADQCITISERDFTHDINDPRNTRKSFGPGEIFKPLGAYEIRGETSSTAAPLKAGQWHHFVVECIDTKWTLWIDGVETLTMTLKHSKIEKESINFIAFGPLMLDDIIVESL